MFPGDTKFRTDPSIDKNVLSKYLLLITCVKEKELCTTHKKWVGMNFMLTLQFVRNKIWNNLNMP
jgi:hypothetical protein